MAVRHSLSRTGTSVRPSRSRGSSSSLLPTPLPFDMLDFDPLDFNPRFTCAVVEAAPSDGRFFHVPKGEAVPLVGPIVRVAPDGGSEWYGQITADGGVDFSGLFCGPSPAHRTFPDFSSNAQRPWDEHDDIKRDISSCPLQSGRTPADCERR
jgi:hypothetical protein